MAANGPNKSPEEILRNYLESQGKPVELINMIVGLFSSLSLQKQTKMLQDAQREIQQDVPRKGPRG